MYRLGLREIEYKADRINKEYAEIFGDSMIFFREDHRSLNLKTQELVNFYIILNWFYGLLFERGTQNIKYLNTKIDYKGITTITFLKELSYLRTYFNHSLNTNKLRDKDIINSVEELFRSLTGENINTATEKDLRVINDYLSDQVLNFLTQIHIFMQDIQSDEYFFVIKEEWESYIQNIVSFDVVREIFREVCSSIGYDFFDAGAVCSRNYTNWMDDLVLVDTSTIESTKAGLAKIIERDLLRSKILPIDGNDIIDHFGISPGKEVGLKLKKAEKIFDKEPCSKDELLTKLAN